MGNPGTMVGGMPAGAMAGLGRGLASAGAAVSHRARSWLGRIGPRPRRPLELSLGEAVSPAIIQCDRPGLRLPLLAPEPGPTPVVTAPASLRRRPARGDGPAARRAGSAAAAVSAATGAGQPPDQRLRGSPRGDRGRQSRAGGRRSYARHLCEDDSGLRQGHAVSAQCT